MRVLFETELADSYENASARISERLSAAVFGGIHYFGISPSGIAGAFIGWFLAKSIHETKGSFRAWVIHFAQDIVIMLFLFMKS